MQSIRSIAVLFVAGILTGFGVAAAPAHAQESQPRAYTNRGHTVFVNRDENGRTRTKIIVQKRSYLDPGTEPLPSERNVLDYVQPPDYHANSVLNHTIFGSDMTALPGPFDLPSAHNPWIHAP
jgi:hypothetical protein